MTRQKTKKPKNGPVTILLIEDSPTDRKVYRRFLEEQDRLAIRVVEAQTGKEALELCEREHPDCIVVDFKLPDTTALQLIPRIKEISKAPIVFFTGEPVALAQTRAYRDGANICLSKDFLSSESFQAAVFEALEGGRTVD